MLEETTQRNSLSIAILFSSDLADTILNDLLSVDSNNL